VEDSRKNIFWGQNNNEIIYCAAAIGIVMNVNTREQKYMGAGLASITEGHVHEIMSLGICQKRRLCVTGSSGTFPEIIVWDTENMEVLERTKLTRNTRAISPIRFSKDGKYLFCADRHNKPNIYAYQTRPL
jgi:WD40 repeat protein